MTITIIQADLEESAPAAGRLRQPTHFAQALARALSQRGWSQKDLAERSGLSQPSVSRYLRRESRPRLEDTVKMAGALGISLDALCHAHCPVPKPTRFPGSVVFCKQMGIHHSHLYRVLMGERQSRVLVNGYAAFLREKGISWPSAAKVKPQAA